MANLTPVSRTFPFVPRVVMQGAEAMPYLTQVFEDISMMTIREEELANIPLSLTGRSASLDELKTILVEGGLG